MELSTRELMEILKCRGQSVNQYLCRSDFAHIQRYRKGSVYYYDNIQESDLKLLKEYIYRGIKRSGRLKRKKQEIGK